MVINYNILIQIVTPISKLLAPKDIQNHASGNSGFLEVLDLQRRTLQYLPVSE